MRRDESHDPFSKSKKAILRQQKIDSVTDNNKTAKPQFKTSEAPYTDIHTSRHVEPKRVALTSGKIHSSSSVRKSYADSTHKQKKKRYAYAREG